jgi:3-phenylpropionate/trans-cinnamate dioxygenase ferredoxin reductase subunit
MQHFVVIGGGQAGATLVARLRADGFDGKITLIGAEPVHPYQRPPLSKAYMLGEMELSRLLLRAPEWYAENNIDLMLDTRVVGVNAEAKTITLQGEVEMAYDELAICTGSHPRTLPAAIGGNLDGVYTVRDLKDADTMAPEFTAGRKLLVIGGGYIGLEAAAVAAKKGCEVTLVEMAPRILQRVACPETSDYFRDLHTQHGVKIIEGVGLDHLVGTDRVTGAVLADGTELDVDFAIVGVGIMPATILAEAAGAACSNGIDTDAQGRTTVPHISAAGDCANLTFKGQRLRIESVGNAIDQAEVVAKNMMGGSVDYTPKPWFWSDQYDVKLQIAGLNIGYDAVHVKTYADTPDARVHWYYQGDTLIAVDAINAGRDYMVGKRLIEAGKSPAPEVMVDETTNLKALLK